ncbi:MAG: hypothetical protein ACTS41_01005 [Candidatus Hodgkinia cicadicola]
MQLSTILRNIIKSFVLFPFFRIGSFLYVYALTGGRRGITLNHLRDLLIPSLRFVKTYSS